MQNNAIIIQHLYCNSETAEWVALTAPRTLRYCRAHEFDYRLMMGTIERYQGKRTTGHWAVPYLISQALEQGYQYVIYLDADCIIVDTSVDLRQACQPDKIGAVWHDLSYHDPDWSHFNAGALYVSNSVHMRAFVGQWLSQFPGQAPFPWWEQGVLNRLGTKRGILNKLDNAWNAGHVSPAEHKIVWGLHGIPDRLEAMKRAMAEIEAAELQPT
jgi:hypothetical protein